MRRVHFATSLLYVFLLFFALLQGVRTLRQTNWSVRTAWRVLPRHGVWRSVRFIADPYTADFTLFLRSRIPPQGIMVLPPPSKDAPSFYHQTISSSWAFLPRVVKINCPNEDCVVDFVHAGRAYVPWFRGEPPADIPPSSWLPYNTERGLLVPVGVASSYSPPSEGWSVLFRHAFLGIGLLFVWWFAGYALLERFSLPPLGPGARPALAWLLGTAMASFGFLSLLALGFPSRVAAAVVIGGLLFLSLTALQRLRFQWVKGLRFNFTLDIWMMTILAVYLLGLTFLGWAKGYHTDDALGIWGAKGYALADWGLEDMRQVGLYRDYPLYIPSLIGIFRALTGDEMVESKALFGLFALFLGLWFYGRLRSRLAPFPSFLATWLLITTPWYAQHGMIGYANLPFSLPLLVAASWPIGHAGRLPGLLLGVAVWMRPEGIYLALLVLLVRIVFLRGTPFWMTRSFHWIWPYTLASVTWLVAHRFLYPNRRLSQEILGMIVQHMGDTALLSYLKDVGMFFVQGVWGGAWGYIGPSFLVLLVAMFMWRRWRKGLQEADLLIFTGVAVLVFFVMLYAFLGFDSAWSLTWWLETGFYRMIAPGMMMIWSGIWLGLGFLNET